MTVSEARLDAAEKALVDLKRKIDSYHTILERIARERATQTDPMVIQALDRIEGKR